MWNLSCATAVVRVGLCILPRTTPHRPAWTFSATPCSWSTALRLGLRRSSSTRSRSNSLLYSASRTEKKCGSSSVSLNSQKNVKSRVSTRQSWSQSDRASSICAAAPWEAACFSFKTPSIFSLGGRFHMFRFPWAALCFGGYEWELPLLGWKQKCGMGTGWDLVEVLGIEKSLESLQIRNLLSQLCCTWTSQMPK